MLHKTIHGDLLSINILTRKTKALRAYTINGIQYIVKSFLQYVITDFGKSRSYDEVIIPIIIEDLKLTDIKDTERILSINRFQLINPQLLETFRRENLNILINPIFDPLTLRTITI